MDNSPIIDPVRTEGPEQNSSSPGLEHARDHESPGQPVKRWLERFGQLEWGDRLNMIFAAVLGGVLVVVLSPILLVLWIWVQAANGAGRSTRSESAEAKLQRP